MNADRQIGLLLPCNVAVRADTTAGGDAVIIDAMDPQVMAQLSDQPGLRDVADEATAKLQAAIDSLAPPEWLPTAQERLAEGNERHRRVIRSSWFAARRRQLMGEVVNGTPPCVRESWPDLGVGLFLWVFRVKGRWERSG